MNGIETAAQDGDEPLPPVEIIAFTVVELDAMATKKGWAPENRPSREMVALARAVLDRR